jgi:hypothetical protein
MSRFEGPPDDESREPRLSSQHEVIRSLMADGAWRTLPQIEAITGYPPASISAQLRHLRKPRFGSWILDKRHTERGLWEYQILPSFRLEG